MLRLCSVDTYKLIWKKGKCTVLLYSYVPQRCYFQSNIGWCKHIVKYSLIVAHVHVCAPAVLSCVLCNPEYCHFTNHLLFSSHLMDSSFSLILDLYEYYMYIFSGKTGFICGQREVLGAVLSTFKLGI